MFDYVAALKQGLGASEADVRRAQEELYDRKIGQTVMHCRVKRGWTQKRLAETMGVSQAYICMVEKGRCRPSHKQLQRIAEILDGRMCAPTMKLDQFADFWEQLNGQDT